MIKAIVAMDLNGGIGVNGIMPWHLPEDLKEFRKITIGHPVVMGRKTYDSLGKALDGRMNIVLSNDPAFKAEDAYVYQSIQEMLHDNVDDEDFFVIGGANLIEQFMPKIDRLYVTMVYGTYECDTFLRVPWDQFHVTTVTPGPKNKNDKYTHTYLVLDRK